ncbi:hypothetical protein H920_19894 [Fukomys damarensis]|uniref:Uncharacterized protein n=1 Tax=Fukomys damarensis TaxID=885580 RepID=A0A091CMK6_FUKDA|nr:hypothetical protein H920_19894 [Fukomys damarensis]
MRNQFSGNSAAKPATFGREAGSLSAQALRVSRLENRRSPRGGDVRRMRPELKALALSAEKIDALENDNA